MKLKYSIMWFEDQPNTVENFKSRLETFLKEHGFSLDVKMYSTISHEDIENLRSKLEKYNPYDLIIFDHDLGNNNLGSSIAKELRRRIFTDMVYYSAAGLDVLRDELYKKKIDGVFVVNKRTFISDMQGIIEDHIYKLTDMNNMRGLVLDSISEIEMKLRTVLSSRIRNMDIAKKRTALDKFTRHHASRSQKLKKLTQSLTEGTLEKHVFDFFCVDFNFIRCRLSTIERSCQILKANGLLEEMQKLRNILAHNPYTIDENNNNVSISSNGVTYNFDFDKFKDIRKNLLKIFEELEELN